MLRTRAAQVASALVLPLLDAPVESGFEMLLLTTPEGLELRVLDGEAELRGGRGVRADWERIDIASGAGRSFKQPIAKAVGLRSMRDLPLTVLDATAGWGRDAWLLAALGCEVRALERSRVLATLLEEARSRLSPLQPEVAARLEIVAGDSRDYLERCLRSRAARPSVVYLDPMFTGAARRKTAEQKSMRVLRRLVGPDEDAPQLFALALQVATKRVVVKRPDKGGRDFGLKPTATHQGKGFCFDVYLPRQ